MREKIHFPDWTGQAEQMMSKGEDEKRPVLGEYKAREYDRLRRLVSVEITGGSCLFQTFANEAEREAAYLEADRRTAWKNALQIAELLWKNDSHGKYVVIFRPANLNTGPESIGVFRVFNVCDL